DVLGLVADRAAIEQVFHDVKEVWGAGQQQLRNVHANVGAYHLNLWAYTVVELWAWDRGEDELADRRASPWDAEWRRPSPAERRRTNRSSRRRPRSGSLKVHCPSARPPLLSLSFRGVASLVGWAESSRPTGKLVGVGGPRRLGPPDDMRTRR